MRIGGRKARFPAGEKATPIPDDPMSRIDTNLFSVQLGLLPSDRARMKETEPIRCDGCSAVVSCLDKVVGNEWKCRFCGSVKTLTKEQKNEVPTTSTVDYVRGIGKGTSETVVFCIDTSGSMDDYVSSMDKSSSNDDDVSSNDSSASNDEDRSKLMTRLDAVKESLRSNIEAMQAAGGSQKVCIVEFESDVVLHGDCTNGPIGVESRLRDDYDGMVAFAQQCAIPQPLNLSYNHVLDRVNGLETHGCTALGPALLLATVIAGREGQGKVILCTDGQANGGMGSDSSDKGFYRRVGELAKQNGVVIDINTTEGCDSDVRVIGEASALTGGTVTVVKPGEVTDAFRSNLDQTVVATDARLTFRTHPDVRITDLGGTKQLGGNVNAVKTVRNDTVFMFRYRLASDQQPDVKAMPAFPLQVQVDYVTPAGLRVTRVISEDVSVAAAGERIAYNADVVQDAFIQQIAAEAREGNEAKSAELLEQLKVVQAHCRARNQDAYSDVTEQLERALEDGGRSDVDAMVLHNASNFSALRTKRPDAWRCYCCGCPLV